MRKPIAIGVVGKMPLDRAKDSAKVFGTEGNVSEQSGTSIFDPTLCELVYRWFSPPAGLVLDPFAGGSVRGIVAAKLGRNYVGVDLAGGQVDENKKQWEEINKIGTNGDCYPE